MRLQLIIATLCALVVAGSSGVFAQASATTARVREITQIRSDLYLVRDGPLYTVALVTSEGIVLADPLSRTTAIWMRDEFRGRFQQDVRFVLHTTHHYARAAGASVFADTADGAAHTTFSAALMQARAQQPEHYRFAPHVTILFARDRVITLDNRTVAVLLHLPSSRQPDATAILFPRERVVFTNDAAGSVTVPFSFGAQKSGDVFDWLETLAPLEFDSLILGDGRTLSRSDVDELATYLRALRSTVLSGAHAGRSLQQIQLSPSLDRLNKSPHYANRASQISTIYTSMNSMPLKIAAGGGTNWAQLSPDFCDGRSSCTGGGAVPAMSVAISAGVVRALDVRVELMLSGQSWSARAAPGADQEAARRRSRGAILLGFPLGLNRLSVAGVGGLSMTVDDVKGLTRVKGMLRPTGGNHPIDERTACFGITFGGDIEYYLGHGLGVRVPVRVTRLFAQPASDSYRDSTLDLQAGVQFTFTLLNRVTYR